MRYEVKAISVWSFVKVSFFIHLIFSLFFGFFTAILISFSMAFSDEFGGYAFDEPSSSDPATLLGILFLSIFFSVGYTAFATFCSLIFAWLYNIIARLLGGLELNLEPIKEKTESIFVAKKDPVTTYLAQTPPPQFSAPATSEIMPTEETPETDQTKENQPAESDDSEKETTEEDDHQGDRPQS